MKISHLFSLTALVLIIFTGCKKDSSEVFVRNPSKAVQFATVKGTALAANGTTPIAYAFVYADEKTSPYNCRTNKDGYFEFQVPITTKKIIIESGDGKIFFSEVSVELKSGQTMQLPSTETILDCRGRMAYIAGAFDKIEAIVHDSLGYPITEITNADLANPSTINNYNAIFINCGASNPLDSLSYVNLQAFVAQGGSLYVSDFAVCYLLGTYSGTCTRDLGFVDDSKLCTIKSGVSGIVNNVAVNAVGLQTALGANNVNINFDLGGWEKVTNYDAAFWEVMLTDNTMGNGPLLLHNHSQGGSNSGHIYYTCFHNEPNGAITATAQTILQYIIMNL